MAAGIRALARELERIAVARKALGRAIHPQELRAAQPVLEHDLDPALEQAGIGVVADAHPDVGGDLQPVRGFQDEVGHRVCHIVTGGVRPAELDVARVAQQQTGDVERRVVVGQDAGGLVSLVVGQEQDVQSPGCAAAVVHPGCHQIPEDPLARLSERRRRLGDQPGVHLGDLFEVAAHLRLGLRRRHLPRSLDMPPDPILHAQDDIGQPGVEAIVLRRVDLTIIGDLLQQAAEAELQTDGEVGAKMLRTADTAVDLVFALLGVQVREVEIGVPVLLPI